MFKRESGFTLIELMVAIAVVAILLLVAIPNFGSFVSQSRVDSAQNQLISSISFARSEAIKRGERVVICGKVNNANSCNGTDQSGTKDWSDGWLVYLDEDEDLSIDADGLLRVYSDFADSLNITFSNGDVVIYNGFGLLDTATTSDETFAISDTGSSDAGQGISVRPTGRVRICEDWVVSGATCND